MCLFTNDDVWLRHLLDSYIYYEVEDTAYTWQSSSCFPVTLLYNFTTALETV